MANNAQTGATRPALLLTRPRQAAARFADMLDPRLLRGVQVCISPLVEIQPLGMHVDLSQAAGVIFTSASGVAHGPAGQPLTAHCVGRGTATAARAAGWQVAHVAENAEALVALLAGQAGPLIHIAGVHRRGEIAERLSAAGTPTHAIAVYDQPLRPLTEEAQQILGGNRPVIVPLFSPRTAGQFAMQARPGANLLLLGMSAAVIDALGDFPAGLVQQVPGPTAEQMRRGVEKLLRGDSFA